MTDSKLTPQQASDALPGWRYLVGRMELTVRTGSFARGLQFVNRVGELAEAGNHHPDIDLRYGLVHLRLMSHDVQGITARDVLLGTQVSNVVADLGLDVDRARLQTVEVAIDAMDIALVRPFWEAVLGFSRLEEDLVDRDGIGPSFWFQQMDEPRLQRNRIHIDVSVAHDEGERRVRAALDAGGTLVSVADAPAFWVLADAEGNEACVCTWQGRH